LEVNRVLLVGMTGVLGDIVRDALVEQPDVEVVGDVPEAGARTAADLHQPSVIVWGIRTQPNPRALLHDLLYGHRTVRLLTVECDGRAGHLHELVPRSVSLGELSLGRLVAAIRGNVGVEGEEPRRQPGIPPSP
jgi:hypothetical protein